MLVKQVINKYIDKNYKTINDLNVNRIVEHNDKEKIENTKILIIDDEKTTIEDTLRRIGYQVFWKKDIDNLNEVENYAVIICDYKGVGLKFDNKYEGLNLAKLIRDKYPNKIIYLLSAASFGPDANDYLKCLNELISKGQESKLIDCIKEDIETLFNPKESWNNYKNMLRNKKISEKDIFRLEDLYVCSLNSQKDKLSKSKLFLKVNNNLNVSFDVKIGIIVL